MASIQDKITDVRNAARPNSARVTSGRSAAGATLACDNLAGWPTASKVHFVTYAIDSNSNPVAGTQLDCYGLVSGNNIGSFTVVDGNDTGNSIGDVVEMLPTAAWGQDLADALTLQHSRLGAHVGISNTGGMTNTGGTTTDTLAVSGASTHTGATTLTGPVSGAGYSLATISNPYKFSAYRNTAWTCGVALATIVFDTKNFDTGTNFATGTGLFTAPIAGFYWFNTQVAASTSNGGNNLGQVVLIKNSSTTYVVGGWNIGAISTNAYGGGGRLLQLAANDTIGVQATSSISISGLTGDLYTHFDGFLMSAT